MSSIFEALQRFESERLGIACEQLAQATDLLQAAEREVAREATHLGFIDLSHCRSLLVSPSPQSRLVSLTASESLGAETFRFLGVRLRQIQQHRPIKKLLITSTMPDEGKSMVCGNLAATLARKNRQKVLLLEGDIRRPSLGSKFGLCQLPGLSELLRSDPGRGIANIYHLEGPGFWFLPAGSPAENSLELMQSGRLSELMDQLSGSFDWIVIDSPPVLSVADTSIWMRFTDGIVLVTREGTTERRLLQRGLQVLESSKLLGVVMNSSKNTDDGKYCQYYQGRFATAKPQWDIHQWHWSKLTRFPSFVYLASKLARIGSAARFKDEVTFRLLLSIRWVMEKFRAKLGQN
jgi:capsular exopolysaccharide synthesis family protein